MKKEDAVFLNHLIKSLEESAKNLEQAYKKTDYDKFNKSKKEILQMQEEIGNIIK